MKILRRSFLSILRGTSARRTWRTSSRRSRTNTGNQGNPFAFRQIELCVKLVFSQILREPAQGSARPRPRGLREGLVAVHRVGRQAVKGEIETNGPVASMQDSAISQDILHTAALSPSSPPRAHAKGGGGARERKVSLPPLLYFSPINKSRSQKAPSSLEESPIIEKKKKD